MIWLQLYMQAASDWRQQHCDRDKGLCNSALVPLLYIFSNVHVGVKMHSVERDTGWKDMRDIFLKGQSLVIETSVLVILEMKRGGKTPVLKIAAVSKPYGPLFMKSWKREKKLLCQLCACRDTGSQLGAAPAELPMLAKIAAFSP